MVNRNLMVNSTDQEPTLIMSGALKGLIHLQSTYNLEAAKMARGYFDTTVKAFQVKSVLMQGYFWYTMKIRARQRGKV